MASHPPSRPPSRNPSRPPSRNPSRRLSRPLAAALRPVLVALLAALVLVAVADLATWLTLGRSWAEVEEVQGLLMIWFGLLGAVYALAHGLHLALGLVVDRLPATARAPAERAAALATAVFGALLAFTAARLTLAVDNTLPATGWSAALQYAPAVVAGLLLAVVALEQAIRAPASALEDSSS